MKANTDKHLEDLAEKLMKDLPLEKPTVNFTANVMSLLEAKSSATAYKPLISKRAWFILFTALTALFIFLFFNGDAEAGVWSRQLGLDKINYNAFDGFSGFKLSTVSMYSLAAGTLMILIQLSFLKKYFSSRLKF
ncbi:MAG: hypothetical protein IPL84_11725 [Chitinophagaceae bacterium]|nr:hypothetical protein [Chitinophagaceae bacterium]